MTFFDTFFFPRRFTRFNWVKTFFIKQIEWTVIIKVNNPIDKYPDFSFIRAKKCIGESKQLVMKAYESFFCKNIEIVE
jgi:hypothetical protein